MIRDLLAGARFALRRDGVLEIEDEQVCGRLSRTIELPLLCTRYEEQ
jgi:hypothetical protein